MYYNYADKTILYAVFVSIANFSDAPFPKITMITAPQFIFIKHDDTLPVPGILRI